MLQKFIELAQKNNDIAILWLYGSRADGTFQASSDYDLAIAFNTFLNNPIDNALRPEMLALEWQSGLQFEEKMLSIVDINGIPIALAFEIIQYDNILFCRDEVRLWREENRIYSRMELDITYNMRHYA